MTWNFGIMKILFRTVSEINKHGNWAILAVLLLSFNCVDVLSLKYSRWKYYTLTEIWVWVIAITDSSVQAFGVELQLYHIPYCVSGAVKSLLWTWTCFVLGMFHYYFVIKMWCILTWSMQTSVSAPGTLAFKYMKTAVFTNCWIWPVNFANL